MIAEPRHGDEPRPAFYALARGGWRDYVTLLHPPYTAWHLAYVAIGAALAPTLDGVRLIAALTAFFLAVGVAAHCLDELRGRPLCTQVPSSILVALSAASLTGAVAIGIDGVAVLGRTFAAFVAVGVAIVLVYNLELAGRLLHNAATFALGWGAFPVLASYYAQAGTLRPIALAAAAGATLLSLVQRQLSLAARRRRRVEHTVEGLQGPETALRLLAVGIVATAMLLVLIRLA